MRDIEEHGILKMQAFTMPELGRSCGNATLDALAGGWHAASVTWSA
jgi:hypothetical protein